MVILKGYMVAIGYSRDGCHRSGYIHLWSYLLWLVEPRHTSYFLGGEAYVWWVLSITSSSEILLFIDHVHSFGIVIKIIYIYFVFLLFLYTT